MFRRCLADIFLFKFTQLWRLSFLHLIFIHISRQDSICRSPKNVRKHLGFFYFFRLIGNGTLTCDILHITPRDILIVRIVAVETNKIMHSIKWTFSLNYCMVILSVEELSSPWITAQKMIFSIKDFFSKCDQIRRILRIWSHLLKKSVMENFIFFCSE